MKNIEKKVFVDKIITDLRHLVISSAEIYGDKPRYIYKRKRDEFIFTYNDLLNQMNEVGTAFFKLGIMGKTVAVIGDTHPAYITAYFATVNGNGCIVPLDKELGDEEIVNFINFGEIEAVVYTECFNNRMALLADKLPNVRYFIPVYGDTENVSGEKIIAWDTLLETGRAALADGVRDYIDIKIDMEKPCAMLFTSGTMGTSKGVLLSQKNLTAATNSSCTSMSFMTCDTRLVSVLPVYHTYEMTCGHLAATNKGMTSYINDSIKYVVRNMGAFKPTAMLFVPLFVETIYKRIWDGIEKKGITKKVRKAMKLSNALRKVGIDLRKKFFGEILSTFGGELECIVCGGAPIEHTLIEDFDAFGITVLNGYGITECSPLVAVNIPGHVRRDTVGWTVDNCQAKVIPDEGQRTGEILVKGENVMIGYYKNEEATKNAFTEDGWYKSGDVGFIDKDNYIHITGRKKNIIILSNGKNVYPEEIEQHLSHINLIQECVVVGRANDKKEVVLTALIYPNQELVENMTPEEIHAKLKDAVNEVNKNLPVFKHVNEIEVRETEFEKTTSKKIKRYKIN